MPNYRFVEFELNEADFCLNRAGQRIALEPKALRVLTLLVSRAGRLVEKQELLESVWPNTFVEENTLTRTIGVLRRELGDSPRDSKLIETVPTRGYRFIAPVEVLPDASSTPLQAPMIIAGGESSSVAAANGTNVKMRSQAVEILPGSEIYGETVDDRSDHPER